VSIVHEGIAQDAHGRWRLVELESRSSLKSKSILLYKGDTQKVELLTRAGSELSKTAEAVVPGILDAAVSFGDDIAAAFSIVGEDRSKGGDIEVVLFDRKLSNKREIFKQRTPRPSVLSLEDLGERLLISFFDSKFFTQTGFLLASAEGKQAFAQVFRTRLGMYTAARRDGSIIVGRPYRDAEEQTVELRVWKETRWVELPSLRGVSAVASFDVEGDTEEEILFADGWHQNYRLSAEARLSMLSCRQNFSRCFLRHLDSIDGQDRIEKIRPIKLGDRIVVFVHGSRYVDAYYPEQDWRRTRVYASEKEMPLVDFAVLDGDNNGVYLAILDGDLKLKRVALEGSKSG
jgi:hypothetical protein